METETDCFFPVSSYTDGRRACFPFFGESAKRNQLSGGIIKNKCYLCGTNASQELNVVKFHRSYHFVRELKANSLASENGAKGIGI